MQLPSATDGVDIEKYVPRGTQYARRTDRAGVLKTEFVALRKPPRRVTCGASFVAIGLETPTYGKR